MYSVHPIVRNRGIPQLELACQRASQAVSLSRRLPLDPSDRDEYPSAPAAHILNYPS